MIMKKKRRVSEKDFRLLLSFLTDHNAGTQTVVKEQLRHVLKVHPRYLKLIKDIGDPRIRKTANMFLEELRFKEIEPDFIRLFQQGKNLDLEKGVYLLATIEYPTLKMKAISDPLDKMAKDVDRLIASQNPLPTRAISAMRQYLFEIKKFQGNEANYYDPDNIFLNKVIKTKKGIPISLSCVYLFLAWRLKLLVHGVGLPGHFIVGHRVPRGVVYIDPFRSGKILRVKDCDVLVRRLGIPFKHSYLDPAANLQILARMIVNLINIYTDQGNTVRAHWLAKLFQYLQ